MAAVATQMIAMGGTVSQGKGMAPLVLRLQTMHVFLRLLSLECLDCPRRATGGSGCLTGEGHGAVLDPAKS